MSDPIAPARGIFWATFYSVALLIFLALMLAGCDSAATAANRALLTATPMVRASGGSSSYLTVTACAVTAQGGNTLAEMMTTLASNGTLVAATDGGQARLTLNACPFPPDAAVIAAAASAAQAAARGRR